MCQHMERKYRFCYHLCGEGTKEAAVEAIAKQSLLLQGGQTGSPKMSVGGRGAGGLQSASWLSCPRAFCQELSFSSVLL